MKAVHTSALWLILCCFSVSGLMAQSDAEPKTLMGDGAGFQTIGFSIAPGFAFTQMDQAAASLFTLRGGLNVGNQLTVGGYYHVSLNQIMPQSETMSGIYMDYWSAGGMLEYTLLSNKLVHLTLPLNIGIGEVEMDNEIGEAGLGEATFLMIEPSALLEINLHKYVRLNLGSSYRIVNSMTYRNFDQSALSGFAGHAGLRFGLFR